MESTYFADRAAEFLERHKDQARSRWSSASTTRTPRSSFPDEWAGRFRPERLPGPRRSRRPTGADQPKIFRDLTAGRVQGIQAAYYTSLSFLDHQVGRVLDALDASGLADDTIVVYLGDNGYMLGQHGRFEKHCFYEPAVRVPLIVRWPGHLPAGPEGDGPGRAGRRLADARSTCCGCPAPPDLHGRSLVPLLAGRAGGQGPRRRLQRVPRERGGDGPLRPLQADRRHRPQAAAGRLRDRHPLPGPYERLYDLEADPERDDRPRAIGPSSPPVVEPAPPELHDRLVSTREGVEPSPPASRQIEAIHWCLVPRRD